MKAPTRNEVLALGAVLLVHASVLLWYFVPVVSGTDANGYHKAARMFAQSGSYEQTRDNIAEFVGRMWVEDVDGHFFPKYPIVYPTVAGFALRIWGEPAGLWVSPILMILAILGSWVAARAVLPGWAAVAVAAMMATTPLCNFFGAAQESHATSVFLLTWGYAAFFWQTRLVGPRAVALAVAAGLLLGTSVGARYTNVLLLLPVGLWFLLELRPFRWAPVAGFAAGASVPGLWLAGYQITTFGGIFRTGYALTSEQDAFALSYFLLNLRLYVPGLATHGVGPMVVLAGLGLVLTFARSWRRGLFFVGWMVPLFLLNTSYYWAPEIHPPSYMRFLLPLVLPSLLLAGNSLVELREVFAARGRQVVMGMIGAALFVHLAWGGFLSLQLLETRRKHHSLEQRRQQFIARHVPEGAVLFADASWAEGLDYLERYRLYPISILFQNQVEFQLESEPQAGPWGLQARRREKLREAFVEADYKEFRKRIHVLINPRRQQRRVFVVATQNKTENFIQVYDKRWQIEPVALEDEPTSPHRLFPVGRTLTRNPTENFQEADERAAIVEVKRFLGRQGDFDDDGS